MNIKRGVKSKNPVFFYGLLDILKTNKNPQKRLYNGKNKHFLRLDFIQNNKTNEVLNDTNYSN